MGGFGKCRLAYSIDKMNADRVLVNRRYGCETMAFATILCIEKTEILTQNTMPVVESYICGKKIDPPDNKASLPPMVISLLYEGIAYNTMGTVGYLPRVSSTWCLLDGGNIEISGSPTEKAILQWGVNIGMDFEAVGAESSIIHAFPFTSEKKRSGVALKVTDSEARLHWKGGAKIILASCSQYLDSHGNVLPLDQDTVKVYTIVIKDMAAQRLRCVAFAYQPFGLSDIPTAEEECDLILLAVVGLEDPCRPKVINEIQSCIDAGVKVKMVTGESLQTAIAIATECKILSQPNAVEPNIIEGSRFRAMSQLEREDISEKILVMGRASPNDKFLLVQALRKKGQVVGVTGNGTNDVPALLEADIGLAMGMKGTEVAKEKADILILDDDFATVVKVIRWGSIYLCQYSKIHSV